MKHGKWGVYSCMGMPAKKAKQVLELRKLQVEPPMKATAAAAFPYRVTATLQPDCFPPSVAVMPSKALFLTIVLHPTVS